MADDSFKGPNYLKAAFANAYNLSLLTGAVVAAAATGDWLIAAGAGALEALWLAFGPDLKPFQRAVREDARKEKEKADRARVDELVKDLPEREWQRAKALDETRREIERDMQHNPTFQVMVLQTELDKLVSLHQGFVRLAYSCMRSENYLQMLDMNELKRQLESQKLVMERAPDEAVKELARKNAAVLEKRVAAIQDIQNFLARARGQMNLIENTVRLLRDQALTMTSPAQLTEQLDDLVSGVEAIQQSARDAEALFSSTSGLVPVAPVEGEPPARGDGQRVR